MGHDVPDSLASETEKPRFNLNRVGVMRKLDVNARHGANA